MFQAWKEDSFALQNAGGHGPSRGLGAPCALNPILPQNCGVPGHLEFGKGGVRIGPSAVVLTLQVAGLPPTCRAAISLCDLF